MKKLFVLLLALTVLAGAVFAQATVNGYIRSMGPLNFDAETFSIVNRLRLNLGWTSEDKMVKFGARVQNDGTAFAAPNYMYGQVKLAEGKVAISGGKLWNFDYDIESGFSDYGGMQIVNGGWFLGTAGMLVQFLPVEALSIGLAVVPNGSDIGIDNFGLYAKYAIADIGNFVFASMFKDPFDTGYMSASFVLTAVDSLTVTLGYKGLVTNDIYGIVKYAQDALAAEVAADFNLTNETLYLEGYVKYVAGDITVAALVGVDNDLTRLANTFWVGGEFYYNVGKGQLVLLASYGDPLGFSVTPIVKVNF